MGGMFGLPEHHKDGVPWGLRKTGTRLSEEEVQELRDYMTPRSTTRSKAPGDKGKAPSGSSSPVSRPGPMQGPPDVLSLLQDPYMPNVGEYDPVEYGPDVPMLAAMMSSPDMSVDPINTPLDMAGMDKPRTDVADYLPIMGNMPNLKDMTRPEAPASRWPWFYPRHRRR